MSRTQEKSSEPSIGHFFNRGATILAHEPFPRYLAPARTANGIPFFGSGPIPVATSVAAFGSGPAPQASRAPALNLASRAAAAAAAMLLTGAIPLARGQNDAATPASRSSSQPATAPAASAPATPDPAQTPPAQADSAGKSSAVCFKLTGHCVDGSKKPAARSGTAAPAKDAGKKPLNLNAPDVRSVVPAQELQEPLPSQEQIVETQESETVSVKTDHGVPPDVPGGFGALWWALNHPSQAWRIVAPAE